MVEPESLVNIPPVEAGPGFADDGEARFRARDHTRLDLDLIAYGNIFRWLAYDPGRNKIKALRPICNDYPPWFEPPSE